VIPLCCTVGEPKQGAIFVVHGGIFSDQTVTIDSLNNFDRKKFPTVCGPQAAGRRDRGLTLMQEMMWSDPTEDGSDGCVPSFRGTGVEFGPDYVTSFLRKNGFSQLVRSHEAIQEGYEMSTKGCGPLSRLPADLRMYTVFSASNYSDGSNDGAVLHYTTLKTPPEPYIWRTNARPNRGKVAIRNRIKITELICRRHHRLQRAFEEKDTKSTKTVSLEDWCEVMTNGLRLKINWKSIQPHLAPEESDKTIKYEQFLDQYSMQKLGKAKVPPALRPALASLYDHFPMLKAVFKKWDINSDGQISKAEFIKGIGALNKLKPPHSEDLDAESLFELCDLDNSGEVELDEFCECYRLYAALI